MTENRLLPIDEPFHNWYRFVLSFPAHFVRKYIDEFGLTSGQIILDPFCGTGTTAVEAKLNGIRSVGLEANPFPAFASKVKTNYSIDPYLLMVAANRIAQRAREKIEAEKRPRVLDADAQRALIKNSISPRPLHKVLILLEEIEAMEGSPYFDYLLLALGNGLAKHIGNLRFGPEVGIGPIKEDVEVVMIWTQQIATMVRDLLSITGERGSLPNASIKLADARTAHYSIPANSIDAVITSPPYPNEKDYTRTTRLETIVLGFADDILGIRRNKKRMVRSNSRSIYVTDDDHRIIMGNKEIVGLAEKIEARRVELGKTSGFEKQYSRIVLQYFGGMARHFSNLRWGLKSGARLAYMVGDQASYFRIMIRTGHLLAEIAHDFGYHVEGIELFRTRKATATGDDLNEEILILRWDG